MKQSSNIITLKIRYQTDASSLSLITMLQKQFNNCLRFTYNRLHNNKNLTTKELTMLQKNLNHIDLVKSHLKNSAIHKAKDMITSCADKPAIFGGKTNFIKRCLNKISKEDFLKKGFFLYIPLEKQTKMETDYLMLRIIKRFYLNLIEIAT